jgi:BolA protein
MLVQCHFASTIPQGRIAMKMRDRIEAKLNEGLQPMSIAVIDESDRHAGHSGAREGGQTHYRIAILSAKFAGKTRVQRHRIVYELLAGEIADGVHALALETRAPGES